MSRMRCTAQSGISSVVVGAVRFEFFTDKYRRFSAFFFTRSYLQLFARAWPVDGCTDEFTRELNRGHAAPRRRNYEW